jgi:YD repeat-containing protein
MFNNVSGVIDEVGVWNGSLYEQGPAPDYAVRLKRRWLDINGSKEVRFEYAYDANFTNKVTSITPHKPDDTLDPNWQGWQYDYYQAGDPSPGSLHHVYRVRSDGATLDLLTTYEYNSNGQATRSTSATGGVIDYFYDSLGNLQTVTGPSNNDVGTRPVTTYGYDAVGRITSVTDALGHQTTYALDALDRATSVTLPKPSTSSTLNFTTTHSYDNYDSVTGLLFTNITDANGQVTKQGYDQFGQLGRSVDALNNATTYTYSHGLLSSIADANGNVTSYTYDTNRRLQKTTFPDGAFETYAYTPDGLLASKTDRKNQTISYTYDHLKRLSQRTYPGSVSIAYTYQGQELTQVIDSSLSPTETHTFAYDTAYRVQTETQAIRGTITQTYNADDSVASMTIQGGPTTGYTYYPDANLNTIIWSPVAGQFKYAYTLKGQYQTISFPNGATRNFSYDDQGRTTGPRLPSVPPEKFSAS